MRSRGDDEEREKLADFSALTYGARIGGPIIKYKLFFFFNYERQEDETPLGELCDLAEDVLALVVQTATGDGEDLDTPPGRDRHLFGVIIILGVIQMGWGVGNEENELDSAVAPPLDLVQGIVQGFIE